ncbi:class I SAM-dependent methyltransferase [Algibacter sp.]|nr:class I SAM-dependent methyltransferase [Flavobacteriaceae bacterium]MDC1226958.1 class I SAM-dependent methyltransferase [Algibacter sp.]
MSFTRKEDRYIETHKTWNNIAQLYEDEFMDFGLYDDTYKRFCDLLSKQDASVLEIGCGLGNITRHILEINPNLKVLATDVSKKMIDLAKKNNPHAETTVLDCRNLKTIDNKYDGIICGFTIPYLSKPDCIKLIYDCGKLLEDDGILYLSFVSGNPEKSGFITGSSGCRSYFYYHEINTIRRELELNQMSVVDIIEKDYKKSDTTSEMHTIIHVKK